MCRAWGLLFILALGGRTLAARADHADTVVAPDGLAGGRYVGSALPGPNALRLAMSLGYGFTESVLGEKNERHQRAMGELGGAWVLAPWFQLALGGEARFDHHSPQGPGHEKGWLFSSHIVTRHAYVFGSGTAIALQPKLIFPGAEDPSRGFQATSVELSALVSQQLPRNLALSLLLGYRFDRSRFAVESATQLPPQERLAAALSDQNAYLLGLLLAAPLKPVNLALEWSWDLAAHSPPHAIESPMRVRALAQRLVGDRWLPGLEVGVDTSKHPPFEGLVRIEPRIWARVSLAIRLDPSSKSSVRLPRPRAVAAPSATPPTAESPLRTTLKIEDTDDEPIVGARVSVSGREYVTDRQGQVELLIPPGVVAVTVEAEGFETHTQSIDRSADATQTRVHLRPRLAASEIKGVVRNLASEPLLAHIEVLPIGVMVDTDRHGAFVIGVAPGDYKLKISADGYESQERPAQVESSGVTIIVVDLKRAQK